MKKIRTYDKKFLYLYINKNKKKKVMSYYSAKVSLSVDSGNKVKKITEMYLVDAQSVTHAEAMVVKDFEGQGIDFEVKAVSNSKIVKVIEHKQ